VGKIRAVDKTCFIGLPGASSSEDMRVIDDGLRQVLLL